MTSRPDIARGNVAVASAATGAPTPEEQERLQALGSQLRCLVCQNQTIADSTAGLAADLRDTVREQIRAGKSDQAIKQYMVERYGEFILYDPPFSLGNALLWTAPFLLALVGAWLVWRVWRRRESVNPPSGADLDADRLQALEERYRRARGPDGK
jgi:cytochrome c-type biogenesis protein CcmH